MSSTLSVSQSGSGQGHPEPQADLTTQSTSAARVGLAPDELKQELDAYAIALSKVPADPLIQPDPLGPAFQPIDRLVERATQAEKLKFGATYTFLNQYATSTPDAVRHNQLSGRLDFTAAWVAYDHEASGGSISMLVRSGANIGTSQQYNLSDRLGSGLYLNCLQGGGAQEPITLNILYWRQDFLRKRLSFYVGKIHPNEYISLSMFNNDERAQFLNGGNDGDLAIASEGTYAGGGAFEFQATRHVYIHAIAVDTEGAQQRNIESLVDRKYMEATELGWFSGLPGQKFQDYRIAFWRDDTKTLGSGYGGGIAFEREFANGWAPFGRYALATRTGAAIRQIESIGLAQVHPFGRRGDMFGVAFNHSEPNQTGKHHESVFESFYRLRLTQSMEIGPDIEISMHPTYAIKTYTRTLVGARLRIIF
jgi:porin